MSLQKDIAKAISGHNAMAVALAKIAVGRTDNGRPLGGEDARQLARTVLIEEGLDWAHVLKVHGEFEQIGKGGRG